MAVGAIIGRGASLLPKLGGLLKAGKVPSTILNTYGTVGTGLAKAVPSVGALALPPGLLVGGASLGLQSMGDDKEGFLKGFGLDSKTRGESLKYDRTTGQVDNGFTTWLGSKVLGQNLSDLNDAARKKSNKDIMGLTQMDEALMSGLGSAQLDTSKVKIGDTESADAYGVRLQGMKSSLEQFNRAKQLGLDTSGMVDVTTGQLKSASLIEGLINDRDLDSDKNVRKRQRKLDEERRIEEKKRYQSDQDWKKLQFATLQEQNRQAREDRVSTQRLQLQLGQLDRAERREIREMDNRRADRKDRQMMIMQMMKGLAQLGGSFAI